MERDETHPAKRAPAAVRDAIKNYQPGQNFVLKRPGKSERSFIYYWGVRVVEQISGETGWICLADAACRERVTYVLMSGGKTSKAATHLAESHGVCSDKTQSESDRKRSREGLCERVRNSELYRSFPIRTNVLMQTLRIVRNNLPFRLGEYEESALINGVAIRENMRVNLTAKLVTHAVVELYTSTKLEITKFLQDNKFADAPRFSIIADFWTPNGLHVKYFGLRLYLITEQWEFKSILLGTRRFNPSYGERERGIQKPLKRWLLRILEDFGLEQEDIFGCTTDAGSDIKWMAGTGLQYKWQWCLPHLISAATKGACGISGNSNPGMVALISRISATVLKVQKVEIMGDLFAELCEMSGHSVNRMVQFRAHRFIGLAKVLERLLTLWDPLRKWFNARMEKLQRDLAANRRITYTIPEPFPLEDDYIDILQIFSLLDPINKLCKKAQAEKPNQVHVLLSLYRLRCVTLGEGAFQHYKSCKERRIYIHVAECSELVLKTRELLRKAFDKRFFVRYQDLAVARKSSFVLEMQLFLHPAFSSMDLVKRTVKAVNPGKSQSTIKQLENAILRLIEDQVKQLMLSFIPKRQQQALLPPSNSDHEPPTMFSDDISDFVNEDYRRPATPDRRETELNQLHADLDVVNAEYNRYLVDEENVRIVNGTMENQLVYWSRQQSTNRYDLLCKAARVVYAFPTTSAQIERDFGVSGQMVTPQRSSISSHNLDMCSFISRNDEWVDITQCERIDEKDVSDYIPANLRIDLNDGQDNDENEETTYDVEDFLSDFFSHTMVSEELY